VALPAYACPDIVSAALAAGAEVVLYDLDPRSLEPEAASFNRALQFNCSQVVITHLFGRVVDLSRWRTLVDRAGAVLIEDAAQHAGGGVQGQQAGSLADWGILSFGRGKGINAGGGGALIVSDRVLGTPARRELSMILSIRPRGGAELLKAFAAQVLTSPQLYSGVRRLPWLRIGETQYSSLRRITSASAATSAMLPDALRAEPEAMAARRNRAAWYRSQLADLPSVHFTLLNGDEQDGSLRYPIRWQGARAPILSGDLLEQSGLAALGVVRSYPRTLLEYGELRQSIINGKDVFPGASELAKSLITLPTHSRITDTIATEIVSRLRVAIKS
jgi:dTDP-4-amino-4,6-dideoxygalactose transaminase